MNGCLDIDHTNFISYAPIIEEVEMSLLIEKNKAIEKYNEISVNLNFYDQYSKICSSTLSDLMQVYVIWMSSHSYRLFPSDFEQVFRIAADHIVYVKDIVPDLYSKVQIQGSVPLSEALDAVDLRIFQETQSLGIANDQLNGISQYVFELVQRIAIKESISIMIQINSNFQNLRMLSKSGIQQEFIETLKLFEHNDVFLDLLQEKVILTFPVESKYRSEIKKVSTEAIKKVFLEILDYSTEKQISSVISNCVAKYFNPVCPTIKFQQFHEGIDLKDISAMYDYAVDVCDVTSIDPVGSTTFDEIRPLLKVLESIYKNH